MYLNKRGFDLVLTFKLQFSQIVTKFLIFSRFNAYFLMPKPYQLYTEIESINSSDPI